MRCHYDVLGVSRDSDDAEIKRNYRKLALQYHPDKNPENLEECTRIFHEIQSAYEVLADKQERAWYDKHRERILRGGDDFVDDSLDVWHYFQPGVFKGYNDGLKGFYTIFRDVFRKIGEEDEAYLEEDDDIYEVPDFGDSNSDYDSVVKGFYSFWLGYCTKKSFVWKEKYDLKQAPNRPTQRLMEKENKKLRDAARKKRNEEVRGLVAYVRKRDKRVEVYRKQLEEKNAENQRKLERRREEDIRRNNQLLDNYEEQEWMTVDHSKLDDIDSHFDKEFGSKHPYSGSSSEDEISDHFYCIACDKNFKSEKALANHEKSKKHKENVELIKSELAGDLLEDLRIDSVSPSEDVDENNDGGSNLNVNSAELERHSSLNLIHNVVKLNVIERGDKGDQHNITNSEASRQPESPIRHVDSLIYTKMKGSQLSRGSVKVKEKKNKVRVKLSDNVFGIEGDEDEEEHWIARHDHVRLSQQDSLAMPRKKTKKQEVKEAAERVRVDVDNVPVNERNALLGKSSITNSLRLVKRPTKADRKKGRRKLLDIDENSKSLHYSNDEGIIFTADNEADGSQTTDSEEEDDVYIDNGNASQSRLLQTDATSDSTHDNNKSLLARKYEEALKKEEAEDGKEVNFVDDVEEQEIGNGSEQLRSPRVTHRVICDSIRYNKDHIEPKGKHILFQKNEGKLKVTSDNQHEKVENNSKKGKNNSEFACEICGKVYPTRNKLFDHIKTEGHAVIKENVTTKKSKKGKTKK